MANKQNNKYKKNNRKYKKKRNRRPHIILQLIQVLIILAIIGYVGKISTGDEVEIGYVKQFFDYISDVLPDIEISTDSKPTTQNTENQDINIDQLQSNKVLNVDACDLSGERKPNVKVDIGYGSRNYYGYTNQYSQLVYVSAEELILQDDSKENVTSQGRYCHDEADVDGVESKTLDQGHAIADSIGGVANAYNITPQDSTLNRQGGYGKFEKEIRNELHNGSKVTDFECIIIYDNTTTQTPSTYIVSYKINGKEYNHTFYN